MGIGKIVPGFSTQWGLLERPRVTAMFERAAHTSLVTVVAGPGYGKTCATADFIAGAGVRAVWTRIGRRDGSAARFWENLVRAIALSFPQRAAWLDSLGFPESASKADAFLQMLENETANGHPLFLVFDDCAYIEDDAVNRLFEAVAEARFDNFCLILVSSRKIGIEITGLRNGGLCRVAAEDLRFDSEETYRFFAARGHFLSDSDLRAVTRYTEGWALALHVL